MTPCEKRGWKVGDRFRVVEDNDAFDGGSIVELYKDDGSSCRLFSLIQGECYYNNCGGDAGAYMVVDLVEKIEDSILERIRKAREELEAAERKYEEQQRVEKWEPMHGDYVAHSNGIVTEGLASVGAKHRHAGAKRHTKALAEKTSRAMVIHNRMLAYVHEHQPDYEFDSMDAFMVEEDAGDGWEIADASCHPIGAVIGPKWVMQKLADDLNSGRVTLLPEGME